MLLSLAAHGAFLAFLLLSLPDAPPPPPPPIQVELVPPPLDSPLPRRAAVQADRAETPAARAGAAPVQPRLLERQQVAPVYAPAAPAAPPPGPAPVTPAGPPARPAAPAAPAADDARDRLGAALRSTGCRNWSLSAAERERCLEREGALAREGAADAERAERRARNEEAAVASRPANAVALVRPPGDDPRNHTMVGPPPVMAGVVIPFGKPPKAIEPIAPSTLRGDDDALRPKPRAN